MAFPVVPLNWFWVKTRNAFTFVWASRLTDLAVSTAIFTGSFASVWGLLNSVFPSALFRYISLGQVLRDVFDDIFSFSGGGGGLFEFILYLAAWDYAVVIWSIVVRFFQLSIPLVFSLTFGRYVNLQWRKIRASFAHDLTYKW